MNSIWCARSNYGQVDERRFTKMQPSRRGSSLAAQCARIPCKFKAAKGILLMQQDAASRLSRAVQFKCRAAGRLWRVSRGSRKAVRTDRRLPMPPPRAPMLRVRAGNCSCCCSRTCSSAQVAAYDPRAEVIRFTNDENIADMAATCRGVRSVPLLGLSLLRPVGPSVSCAGGFYYFGRYATTHCVS